MNSHSKGLAVITGASAGIGAVYANRLAHDGYNLFLVARNQERLEHLANAIATDTGRQVEVLVADLMNPNDLHQLEQRLRNDPTVTLLVNNAGVGATAPLLNSNIADMSRMITLNVEVLTRLTYAVVPAFVARDSGTIINIASIVAVSPETLNGVYGGTKAFVLAFSQSLRHELTHTGIRVQVVLPGATSTNFWKVAGTPVEHLSQEIVMSVDDMVDAALAGLNQGEFVTIPSLPKVEQWEAYEGARQALLPHLSRAVPASRYSAS